MPVSLPFGMAVVVIMGLGLLLGICCCFSPDYS